jgi:protein translocase SecG subunit
MQHVIIVIHLMVVAALVALVLYQKSEGGALGLGSSGFMTGRGQANALTRATGILGTIFFLTSIALTVLPAWQRGPGEGGDWTKAIDQGNISWGAHRAGRRERRQGKHFRAIAARARAATEGGSADDAPGGGLPANAGS